MRTFANLGMVFSFSVGLMVLAAILSALSFLFNPCCLGCPVLLVLPGVSW